MGNGMNKVLSGLYVGSVRDSKDQEQLRLNNITHIISIHDNPKRGQEEIEYLCILASDKPHQNLSQFFTQCNDFIHDARLQGGNVLIHCLAGVSRSVTIAVAYVMSVTTVNWKDALKCVRGARAIANPNLGFQKQLQDFEGRRLREERKRLSHKYGNKIFRKEDEDEVRNLIIVYESLQSLPDESEKTKCSTSLSSSPKRSARLTSSNSASCSGLGNVHRSNDANFNDDNSNNNNYTYKNKNIINSSSDQKKDSNKKYSSNRLNSDPSKLIERSASPVFHKRTF